MDKKTSLKGQNKKRSALDNLMSKLDKQISFETPKGVMDRAKALNKRITDPIGKFEHVDNTTPTVKNPNVALGLGASFVGIASSNPFGKVSNPLVSPNTNPVMSPINRGKRKMKARRRTKAGSVFTADPLQMKSRLANSEQMRKARQAEILRRHNLGANEDEDQDQDLKDNLDFVDDNKYKTMEWTEPDGSKTTLKFDSDGTLVGKETTKSSRPDKFSKDLKKAVDRNAVALKDYEESLMSDPVM